MKFLKVLFFLISILISTFSFSEEINLTPPDKEVKVSIEEPFILSFKLPPVKSAKLYFLARAGDETLEKPAGYSDALIIEINDRKITDPSKLINKKQIFRLKGKPEKEISWYQNNTWMIPISPDYTSVDSHYLYAIENTKACEFIFDITDFVGEENNLKFIRLPRPWSKIPLYFKNVKIIYEKGEDKKVEPKGSKEEEISVKIANEEKIPADEIRILTLPVKEKNKNVYLKISVRRDSERLGGYGHYMQILVNDRFVDASIDRKNKRLINKSFSFKRTGQSETFWNLGDGIYLTFFSPDFKTDVSMYGVLEPDPYTYILDITDLLNEKGINQLYIKNLYSKSHEQQYNRELPLYVNVEVIIKKGEEKKIDTEKIEIKGKPEMEITKKGAIKLNFENTSIILESLFSYPDGGFNKLGEEGSDDEKEWKVEIKKNTKTEGEIFAKGKFYNVNRKLTLKETSILVEDEITNLTSEDIGIIFSNYINFGNIPLYYARIGGRTSQNLNNITNPGNPTIFYPMKNSGIGIVANDDVYRNQGILFYDLDKKITGIKDENFCLGPKKSYKISWSLYFINSDDYYDFINLVRNDWGSNNITIDGPFYFINYGGIVGSTEDGLKKLIESKNAKYIVFWEVRTPNPLSEYDNRKVVAMGTGILNPIFNEELKKVKLAIEKLKKVSSDLKVSLYTHSFFISPEKADDPKYKDSWIVDREGKRAVSQYNTKDYYNYQPVFPTLTNSYGKDYLKLIDWYLNDMGFDWIYWDESTGPGILGETNKTYNAWDGYSAVINPQTKKIEKKFAILPLICDDFIMEVYEKVKKKGGFILFNGAAATKSRLNLPSFVESQDLILRSYNTHLNTPLAYGFGKPSIREIIDRLNYGTIYARTHLDYQSDVVTKFYPITIEEIHSGWIKGKERIITAKSGEYGWDGKYKARIYLYNEKGECINHPSISTYENKFKVNIPSGGIAIIEKVQ